MLREPARRPPVPSGTRTQWSAQPPRVLPPFKGEVASVASRGAGRLPAASTAMLRTVPLPRCGGAGTGGAYPLPARQAGIWVRDAADVLHEVGRHAADPVGAQGQRVGEAAKALGNRADDLIVAADRGK